VKTWGPPRQQKLILWKEEGSRIFLVKRKGEKAVAGKFAEILGLGR
jgi:hypothetical protein